MLNEIIVNTGRKIIMFLHNWNGKEVVDWKVLNEQYPQINGTPKQVYLVNGIDGYVRIVCDVLGRFAKPYDPRSADDIVFPEPTADKDFNHRNDIDKVVFADEYGELGYKSFAKIKAELKEAIKDEVITVDLITKVADFDKGNPNASACGKYTYNKTLGIGMITLDFINRKSQSNSNVDLFEIPAGHPFPLMTLENDLPGTEYLATDPVTGQRNSLKIAKSVYIIANNAMIKGKYNMNHRHKTSFTFLINRN